MLRVDICEKHVQLVSIILINQRLSDAQHKMLRIETKLILFLWSPMAAFIVLAYMRVACVCFCCVSYCNASVGLHMLNLAGLSNKNCWSYVDGSGETEAVDVSQVIACDYPPD
jgi:hypothetical protein